MTAAPQVDTTTDPVRLREQRAAQRMKGLAELLGRRPELWGVYLPADLAAESVLWSA